MSDGNTGKRARIPSVDLLKIIAFLFVVLTHFTHKAGLDSEIHAGRAMLSLDVIFAFASACVPLFLMATGYLMTEKKFSASYYKGLVRIIVIYVMCSILCVAGKVIFYSYPNTPQEYLRHVLKFDGSDYAWYVEMYVCLFLLIPFLNAAYHAIGTRGGKRALIVTMLVLTALPGFLNTFNLSDPSWWADPASSQKFSKIFPDFFTSLYPVTYFFIGSYLKEYPLRIKKRYLLVAWLLTGLLAGGYFFWRFRGGSFYWGAFLTQSSILVAAVSVPLFALIVSLDLSGARRGLRKVLAYLSGLTYGAFLCSAIVDIRFYRWFNRTFTTVSSRLLASPLAILCVAAISLAFAAAIDLLYRGVSRGVSAVVKALKKSKTK